MDNELRVEDLALSYDGALTVRLPKLILKPGEPAVLLGASGSGKSTILECLGFLTFKASFKSYNLRGRELSLLSAEGKKDFRQKEIGFMPQIGGLIPFLTIDDNINLQISLALKVKKGDELFEKCRQRVAKVAHILSIESKLKRYPKALSIGERQRAAFCRAVAAMPNLILIDEPTAALDPKNAHEMFELIKNITEELKIQDQMKWVQLANYVANAAKEIVESEVIFRREPFLKNCFTAISAPTPIAEVVIRKQNN